MNQPPTIAGPRVDTEPLAHKLPEGATDCHAHLFGPTDRFPYAEGRGYTPPEATLQAYTALLDKLGFARAVLVQGNAHGYDNRVLLDALARQPARLRAVAITDEKVGIGELREWNRLGVRGLRFHIFAPGHGPSYRRGVGLDTLRHFAPAMKELGWHAQVWCEGRTLEQAWPALKAAAAGLPIVFDHMCRFVPGQSVDAFALLERLLGEGQCWVKLSGAYRCSSNAPDYPEIEPQHQALLRANPERLLWGSDWPHPQVREDAMPDDGHLVNLMMRWTSSPTDLYKVLVSNPARLYGFPSGSSSAAVPAK